MLNKSFPLWPDALLLAALFLLFAALPAVSGLLEYQRERIGAGEWWRLFTAHFVHLNLNHALLNALGLLLVGVVFARELRRDEWWLLVLGAPLLISAGLWWKQPGLVGYAGFSGVLHGLLYLAVLRLWPASWWLAALLLVVLLARQVWEQTAAYDPGYLRSLIGGAVMPDAHLFGGLCGFLLGLAGLWRDQRRGRLGRPEAAGL